MVKVSPVSASRLFERVIVILPFALYQLMVAVVAAISEAHSAGSIPKIFPVPPTTVSLDYFAYCSTAASLMLVLPYKDLGS